MKRKVYIDCDELYPFYSIVQYDYGTEAELTDDEIAHVERVTKEFYEMQDFLAGKLS